MQVITIQRDFKDWRAAARALLAESIRPEDVLWQEAGAAEPLLAGLGAGAPAFASSRTSRRKTPRVPLQFVECAEDAACHRDPGRWSLMYSVLWRITHGEPKLMHVEVDDDVRRLKLMQSQVTLDTHKMMGFVRFQQVQTEPPHYLAYYRPAHYVLGRAARWFVQRMAGMYWSILTPDESATWDGQELHFAPGVATDPGQGDELEVMWRTYYASVFNPARLSMDTMKRCMPTKYWSSMVETQIIPDMVHDAGRRVRGMIQAQTGGGGAEEKGV